MFCKSCGNRLEHDALYCQYCGNTVKNSEVNDSPVYETIKETCKHCNGSGKCGSYSPLGSVRCATCYHKAIQKYGDEVRGAEVVECGVCDGKGYHIEKYVKSKVLDSTSKNLISPDNFITDIICPKCNKLIKGNIPNTTPETNKYLNMSKQECPKCHGKILIYRQDDGGYIIIKG